MKWMTKVSRSLVVLIPILLLVIAYGLRFRRLPEGSRDVYPFVLWPLVAIVIVLIVIFVMDSIIRHYRR